MSFTQIVKAILH